MKSIFKSSKFFYLVFLLGLLPFFGCGSDDGPVNETLSGEFIPNPTKPGRSEPEHEWIARDPQGYYEYQVRSRIKRYGDIPEVYTVASFLLKFKQGAELTGDEVRAYKAALAHLSNLDAQREGKQDEEPDD